MSDRARASVEQYERRWQDSLAEQAFLKSAADAKALEGVYLANLQAESTSTKARAAGIDPADLKFEMEGQRQRSLFTEKVDKAHILNRGDIPSEFWLQFNERELQSFLDLDTYEANAEGVNNAFRVFEQQLWAAEIAEREAEVEAEFQRRLDIQTREGNPVLQWIPNLFGAQAKKKNIDKAALRQQVHNEVYEIFTPAEALGWWGRRGEDLMGLAGKIPDVFGFILDAQPVLGAPLEYVTLPVIAHFVGSEEEAAAAQKAELRRQVGVPDEELFRANFAGEVDQAWDQLGEEMPDTKEEYMQLANGNEIQAMGFFGADLSMSMDPEEQTKMLDQVRDHTKSVVESLDDEDFHVGTKLLHILGTLDRLGPSKLATYFTLLLDDRDFFDTAMTGNLSKMFGDLENDASLYDNQPSKAMDIDGSLAGLLLDLGGSIMFDPTTWFTGPAAKAASKTAGKALLRAQADDVIRFAADPSRGASSIYTMLSWAGPARGQILRKMGFNKKIIPNGKWAAKPNKARIMQREVLENLLDVEDIRKIDVHEVDNLRHSISERGFDEAIEISVSRGDRTAWVSDGAKRLLAADEVSHVPVRIRITDEVTKGTTVVPGYSAAQVGRMRKALELDDAGSAATRFGPDSQQFQHNIALEKIQPATDAPLGTFDLNGETLSVQKFEGGAGRGLGRGPEEIVYATNPQGELVAFYDGAHMVQAPGYKGALHDVLNVAEEAGEGFLDRLLDRALSSTASFTEDATRFLKNAVRRRLGDSLPEGNRVGKALDDLLEEGEQLGKPLLEPGGNGDVFARPGSILPERMVMGEFQNSDEIFELLVKAEADGAVLDAGQYFAVARSSGEKLRKLLNANAPGRWLERYMGQHSLMKSVFLTGTHAVDDIVDTVARLFGSSTEDIELHLNKILEWEMKNADNAAKHLDALAELEPRRRRLLDILDEVGNLYDGRGKLHGDILDGLDDAAKARYKALRAEAVAEDKALSRAIAKIDAEHGAVGATDELGEIVTEIWADYNRKHIATHPLWQKFVNPETGMVPWEELSKGLKPPKSGAAAKAADEVFSEDMAKVAEELGIDPEKLMSRLSHTQNAQLTMQMPLSPLEMITASATGGAAYTKATHIYGVAHAREAARTLHNLWTVDKVFTVATAGTVAFDELLRIFHRYGAKSFFRWVGDRGVNMEARINALARGKRPRVSSGSEHLSIKKQERLAALKNTSPRLKALERQSYDELGLGFQDITPKDPEFADAAQRWTSGMLQDSGFRAFLEGPDSFRRWFLSPDGERLRKGAVAQFKEGVPETLFVDAADDYYNGWKVLFDDVILKPARKAGRYDEVRNAWLETSRKISGSGGRAHDVPDLVINHLDAVRGVRREIPDKAVVSRMTEFFFDKMFMNPVNSRRGFLSELTRTEETKRLTKLFRDQGRRIVSETEMEQMLGVHGLAGSQRTGLRSVMHQRALDSGVVPESYIQDLVERRVRKEVENVLYNFDSGSRMGAQSRVVFPFGKPWADMAGFWGREMVRKPVLRGWVNEKNFLGLQTLNSKGMLPINRSHMMLSRFANTDFEIDKGVFGGEGGFMPEQEGGLWPGSESTDFSPLFFLPTEGDNPFSYMIPGIGIVPTWGIAAIMDALHDPVKEPEEYQKLQESLGEFLPTARFMQGSAVSRTLGGGAISKLASLGVDLAGMNSNNSYFQVTNMMGDISRETMRTRQISAMLADPDELELLMNADTIEEAELLLQALVVEADRKASAAHGSEVALRFMAPVKSDFDASLAEIQDVWTDALSFPELEHLAPEGVDIKNLSAEQHRQLAADVRSAFFSLEDWQRNALVVQQPSLAVNMVGSWEWTQNAENKGVEGSDRAYRSGGSKKDLARHEALVRQGLIRPVQPIMRARRIIGVIDQARRSSAKQLYQHQVDTVNDALWSIASEDPKTKTMLDLVLGTDFAQTYDLRTPKELWANWSTLEEDFELYIAQELGIEPVKGVSTRKADRTEFDALRKAFNMDVDLKAWNRDWPGLDEEEITKKFKAFPILEIDEQSQVLANALGIDMEVGMGGEALFHDIQQTIAQRHNPILDLIRPSYDYYIGDRSTQSERTMLYEAAQSDLVTPEYQERIHEFLFKDQLMRERRAKDRRNGLGLADQTRMREEFLFIMNGAKDQKTDWEGIWDAQYKRLYGPLDWTPPEPRAPFDEDGRLASDVMIPQIDHVVDGDTLLFRMHRNSPINTSVRLLGIRAPDRSEGEAALEATEALKDALLKAAEEGDNIYLVRDERFGTTDHYGRMLAWLWIGDTPYYEPNDLRPHQDPSGGNR